MEAMTLPGAGRVAGVCRLRRCFVTADVVVLLFLCLPACCVLPFGIGSVTPDDPFVFVGQNLTLECRVPQQPCSDPKGPVFKIRDHAVDMSYVEVVDPNTRRLNYPVTEAVVRLTIVSCFLECPGRGPDLVGKQHVEFDYPAGKLQNLSCIAVNWEDLNCTWDLPYPYLCPDCISVVVHIWQSHREYAPTEQTQTWALWTSKGDNFMWGLFYLLKAEVVYSRGTIVSRSSSQLNISTRSIVKPSGVIDTQNYSCTSNSILVHLNHSDMKHNKMLYVEYSSQWDPHLWHKWSTSWRMRQLGLVNLTDLRPNTSYKLRVAVGPGDNTGHLSDWHNITLKTLPAAPDKAPEVCPGCYSVGLCNASSHCRLQLYWQSIPPRFHNNVIKDYQVSLAQHWTDTRSPPCPRHYPPQVVNSSEDLERLPQQLSGMPPAVDGSGCSSGESNLVAGGTSLLVDVDARKNSLIYVSARTQNELCSPCSLLFIPSHASRPEPVDEVVVEVDAVDQASGQWDGLLHVRWTDPGPETQQFVVVWCPGQHQTCEPTQDIQWEPVPAKATEHTINTSNEYHRQFGSNEFIVGVVRHQRRQHDQCDISSGIKWSPCIYLRNRVPVEPQEVSVTQAGAGQLHVSWKADLCKGGVDVTHFIVLYCPTFQQSTCQGEEREIRVERKESMETMVVGLEGGKVYRVRVMAVSRWGRGPPTTKTLAVGSSTVDRAASWTVAVGILVTIMVIIVLLYFSCTLKRRCRKKSDKFAKTLLGLQRLCDMTENSLKMGQPMGGSRRPVKMDTQASVSSTMPLLEPNVGVVGEGEVDSVLEDPRGDHPQVLEALLSKQGGNCATTQGLDSGVELPHFEGDPQEVLVEGFIGQHQQRAPECQRAQHVVNCVRPNYQPHTPSQPVGTTLPSDTAQDQLSPSSRCETALNQSGVVCGNIGEIVQPTTPTRGGIERDGEDIGGLGHSGCASNLQSQGSSLAVGVKRTAADEACPPVGEANTRKSASEEHACSYVPQTSVVQSPASLNKTHRSDPDLVKEVTELDLTELDLSELEANDETNSPDLMNDLKSELFQSTLIENSSLFHNLGQSPQDLNQTSCTFGTHHASFPDALKDCGGYVHVSCLHVPQYETQEEEVGRGPDLTLSMESLNEEDDETLDTSSSAALVTYAGTVVKDDSACRDRPSGYQSPGQQPSLVVSPYQTHNWAAWPSYSAQVPSAGGYVSR